MSIIDILSGLGETSPISDLFFADSPAFLVGGEDGSIVIANPSAAAFLRAHNVSALVDGKTSLRGPAKARLEELASAEDLSGSARIEMLRFFVGSRAVTLPFMCQRVSAPAPQPNVYAMAAAAPGSELTIADKAAIAFDDDPRPVVLFDKNGERLYANPSARSEDIAGHDELRAADGLFTLTLEDGDLELFAAPQGASLASAPEPEPEPEPEPAPEPRIEDLPARQEKGMSSIAGAARKVVAGLGFGSAASSASTPDARPAAPVAAPPERAELTASADAATEDEIDAREDDARDAIAVAQPGTRFRFTLDSEARIKSTDPDISETGLAGGDGDSLDDLLTGDLASFVDAIEHRDTFNAVQVLWQAQDGGAPVHVEIAGLPLLDGSGGYEGLRGFAVIGERASDWQEDETAEPFDTGTAAITGAGVAASAGVLGADEGEIEKIEASEDTATDAGDVTPPSETTASEVDDMPADDAPMASVTEDDDSVEEASIESDDDVDGDVDRVSDADETTETNDAPVADETDDAPSLLPLVAGGAGAVAAGLNMDRSEDLPRRTTPATPDRLDDNDQRAFAQIAERLNGRVPPEDTSVADSEPAPAIDDENDDDIFEDVLTLAVDEDAQDADEEPTGTDNVARIGRSYESLEGFSPDADSASDDNDTTPETPSEAVSNAAIAAGSLAGAAAGNRLARGRAEDANDFVTLIERLPFGLMFLRDEKPLYANRAMLDLFGYADLDDLEIAGGIHTLFESLADTRQPGKRMLAGITRDGLPIELDARLQLAPWIDGPALLLTARERLSSDSESRIADLESELVELKDILDTATDGVVLFDEDGDIISMNRSAEALFGLDGREIRGAHFATLFEESERDTIEEYLDGLLENGVASVLNDGRKIHGVEKGGGHIPLFLTIGHVGIGERQKFCAVLRDITQWTDGNETGPETESEAETPAAPDAGDKSHSDVLAKVSHEVRTPLNAIVGFADVMLDEQYGPLGNDRYRDYAKDIKASGEHIMSLLNDYLDLSKAETGMMDMDFSQVQLNDVVEQCVAIMQGQANRERVILRTSLAANLPAIVADIRSIRQILLNLISNAVKFTPASGQIIVSTVYTETGEVHLKVRDTGPGMSAEDIATAMQPYRKPASQREGGGSGIGLPLTKALAEANRAVFSLESRTDGGTLAQVAFPSTRVLAE
ncbi:ATP-binding protein [Tepidamorphus sp. 3E244]|uniref:ATP-binding protein n=1 Tax=Tepidamorphus sp. 3E244 TaxID=3385498 RepID=UPI0038FCC72F